MLISDILFIVSLGLESLLLIFFIKYTVRYLKQYQEKVDVYTKWTLILLSLAMCCQIMRMPFSILNITVTTIDDGNNSFTMWVNENTPKLQRLQTLIIFMHGNI